MPRLWTKMALFGLLLGTIGSLAVAVTCILSGRSHAGSWATTAGIVAQIAALVQLEISGLFSKLVEHYADEREYPNGPPSHFVRRLFEHQNPESGSMSALGYLYQDPKTGFWIIIFGSILQLAGEWL